MVVEFFVIFYLKKISLLYNCKPAEKSYRNSTGSIFYIVLLIGWVISVVPICVFMGLQTPSKDCGPFRATSSMFYSVTESIDRITWDWLRDIFWFLGSAPFGAIVALILCVILYYYKAVNEAHMKMIKLLRDQLTLEGKDKQFLLSRVNGLNEKLNYGKNNGQQGGPRQREAW